MAIRSLVQVTAGVLAGAALVGIPTWATAGTHDTTSPSRPGMSSMMNNKQSQEQMTESMSKMMDDAKMRQQMRTLMSDAMGDMPKMGGMSGEKSTHGLSGMHRMRPMTPGSK
ncbi:hypothetical protein GCM10027596_24870 [Nocardioides korecus]